MNNAITNNLNNNSRILVVMLVPLSQVACLSKKLAAYLRIFIVLRSKGSSATHIYVIKCQEVVIALWLGSYM